MRREDLLRVVVAAEARQGHRVRLRFDDGLEGEVDLRDVISEFKNLLAPLADPSYVAQVRVDPQAGTITWPNGVDLDPVVLYCAVKGIPVPTYDRGGRRAKPASTPRRRTSTRSVKAPSRRGATATGRKRGKSGRTRR
jgi:hypothetical protein